MITRRGAGLLVLSAVMLRPLEGHAFDGCRDHVERAEVAQGVPRGLLTAIGYVESGMDPLAINADGVGYHPRSVGEAVSLVRQLRRAGAHYIDVGCMQIDLHYHPDAFPRLEEAFDPGPNAAYGARLLAAGRVDYGDWNSAVAYYHSSNPARQTDYLRLVRDQYAALGDGSALRGAIQPRTTGRPVSGRPRMVTVRLSFMTITRPADGRAMSYGGK